MKEELLRAAEKGCVTVDKFKKFNDDLPMLGEKMMQVGLCNYYDIIFIGGKLLTLRLNVKPIKFDSIPEDRKRCAQGLLDEFLEDHDITKQECEDTCSYSYVMWDAMDNPLKDKFTEFNEHLPELGERFVKEGICNSYKVKRWAGNMDSLQLDVRPMRRSELPLELNIRVNKKFCDFMFSFGITYEESEDSCSGISWIMEGDYNGDSCN